MTTAASPMEDSPRRRTAAACEYCRKKKLKCDGQEPSCSTCSVRGQPCIQNARIQKPRPSNRRITQLEEENRHLRSTLDQIRAQTRTPSSEDCMSEVFKSDEEGNGLRSRRSLKPPQRLAIQAVAEAPDKNEGSYHGPTSALFDENPCFSRNDPQRGEITTVDDERMRFALVAATAKQRHLERINFSSNSVDFDGIDPKLGMELLSLYWSRQLHAGLVVYRPAFMRDMVTGGPYFSKLLLNSMFYSVSKHSTCVSIRREANDRSTAGWSFRQRFTDLLLVEFDKSKITTIQALLIMASSLFTRCDERSISWLYAGHAFNMIVDMGLHVESSSTKDTALEELEICRRVFWSGYMIDKVQCLYQGRHPCLRFSDANVPMTFLDDYEETENFHDKSFMNDCHLGATQSYTISTMSHLCKLSVIMERIQNRFYAVSRSDFTLQSLCKDSAAFHLELKAWRRDLPTYLDFSSSKIDKPYLLPYNLSMLALYNVLIILIFRPIVSEGQLYSESPDTAYHGVAACMSAATEIIQLLRVYETLYDPSSATFSLSYATYISATIHIRTLSQQHNDPSATESLRTCLKALEKHQILYSAAKRARKIVLSMMDRMNVKLEELQESTAVDSMTLGLIDSTNPDQTRQFDSGIVNSRETSCSGMRIMPELRAELFDVHDVVQNLRDEEYMGEGWLDVQQDINFYDLYSSFSAK